MGNITTGITGQRDSVELSARIGARLGAQRVELYQFADPESARLHHRWSALGHSTLAARSVEPGETVPMAWFPWSLGNIRPEEYLFIRNAGALPAVHNGYGTIADSAMSSALLLPVIGQFGPVGAVCAYWSVERSSWASEGRELVCSWARDVLVAGR